MAKPQTEEGYTIIANEILDVLPLFKFNGTQLRILITVIRFTYGFKRKEHELSLKFIQKATMIDKRNIQKEVKKLIDLNVLKVTQEASFTTARTMGLNKDYDSWLIKRSGQIEQEVSNLQGDGELTTPTDGELTNGGDGQNANQEINIKYNSKYIEEEEEEKRKKVAGIISFWDSRGFGHNNLTQKHDLLAWIEDAKNLMKLSLRRWRLLVITTLKTRSMYKEF